MSFSSPAEKLRKILSELRPRPDRIFLLTDSNVEPLAGSYLEACRSVAPTVKLVVAPGEVSKTLAEAGRLARMLSSGGATRTSLMVNVGGGVVSDLGGFTASIFKRGIRTVNVATTLLAAVDAAIGGKTGVDLDSLKNEIGTFHAPEAVVTASDLLLRQPRTVLTDGYAELVKTAMLCDTELYRRALLMDKLTASPEALAEATNRCARFKREVVALDPKENGLRRILNLGHTFGHAFETLLMRRGSPAGHGTAVAHGLLCALIMSHICVGLDSKEIYFYKEFMANVYPRLPLGCPDRDEIISLILHDKKRGADGRPRFVLLEAIARPVEAYSASDDDIAATLEIFNDN